VVGLGRRWWKGEVGGGRGEGIGGGEGVVMKGRRYGRDGCMGGEL